MSKLNIVDSSSSLGCYQDCPQKYAYRYVNKRVPIDDSSSFPAVYGSAFHSMVEKQDCSEHFGELWTDIVGIHYSAYKDYWAGNGKTELKVNTHEYKFDVDLLSGTETGVCGFIDGLGTYGEHERVVVEVKTTAVDEEQYFHRTGTMLQGRLYVAALHELGFPDVSGFLLDVTKRPGIKQKRDRKDRSTVIESDEAYKLRVEEWYWKYREKAFYRRFFPVSKQEVSEVVGEIMQVKELVKTGVFPKNRQNCGRFPVLCDYYDVCFNGSKLSDNSKFKDKSNR